MNMKITPPSVGSTGGADTGEFGKFTTDNSTQPFFGHDASNEIDRLILENEILKEENQDLKLVITGLLSENDQGEWS